MDALELALPRRIELTLWQAKVTVPKGRKAAVIALDRKEDDLPWGMNMLSTSQASPPKTCGIPCDDLYLRVQLVLASFPLVTSAPICTLSTSLAKSLLFGPCTGSGGQLIRRGLSR